MTGGANTGNEMLVERLYDEVAALPFAPESLTPRYLILKCLADKRGEMYADQIAALLDMQGITKQRVKVELTIMSKEARSLIARHASPVSGKYLYSVTSNGLVALKDRLSPRERFVRVTEESLRPYKWLLKELVGFKSIEDIAKVRPLKKQTLRTYLSDLYSLGVIEKRRLPVDTVVRCQTKLGADVVRNTVVYITQYALRPESAGVLKMEPANKLECAHAVWTGEHYAPRDGSTPSQCPNLRWGRCPVRCPDARK